MPLCRKEMLAGRKQFKGTLPVVAACQTVHLRADVWSLLAPPPTPRARTLVPNLSAVVFQ